MFFVSCKFKELEKKDVRNRKKAKKKEGGKRAAHIVALLKNKRATPTSLLWIKRSGTPSSLSI
jgi:hypothetical protein